MTEEKNLSEEKDSGESENIIELKDILDTRSIQSLMDDFYSLTGFGIGILDLHGEVLIVTGWQDICTKFHRVNPQTLKNCVQSDTYLSRNVKRGEFLEYKCKNNLRDIVTPIFVSDRHVGNLFLGQFMYEDEMPELELFGTQAELYGFNNAQYLEALNRVPRWSREKVNTVMSLYSKFAHIISNLLTSNLELKKTLEAKKRSEKVREKLIEDLNRSNKELEQYAYVASHDLQEPLRMVSTYTTMLERKYGNLFDDTAAEYMGIIVEGAKRMQSLIKELLLYSKISNEFRAFEKVDSTSVICKALDNLSIQVLESNAQVHFKYLPAVKANPVLLTQLFQNLISNAIKFKAGIEPEVYIDCKDREDDWLFSVKDNGIGIHPEYFDKIFVIFQRLHRRDEYPGTGVGLTICKKIVEQHGGEIWVESVEGKGTVFYFTLSK